MQVFCNLAFDKTKDGVGDRAMSTTKQTNKLGLPIVIFWLFIVVRKCSLSFFPFADCRFSIYLAQSIHRKRFSCCSSYSFLYLYSISRCPLLFLFPVNQQIHLQGSLVAHLNCKKSDFLILGRLTVVDLSLDM